MGRILVHDEKLAAGRVHILGPGHTQHAPGVAQIIGHTVGGEFTLDAVAGTAHAGAVGAAALDHEPVNAAVEDQPVVKPAVGQRNEIPHRLRRNIGIQLGSDHLTVFHFDGDDGIVHGYAPFIGFSRGQPAPFRVWRRAWRWRPACRRSFYPCTGPAPPSPGCP